MPRAGSSLWASLPSGTESPGNPAGESRLLAPVPHRHHTWTKSQGGGNCDSTVTPFSGWGIFGAQPREGWNVTVTRFTPQVMKHDSLASSPGGCPRQWVPWLPWCRLLTPRLCATGKATFETLDIFRTMDQREFLNIDWD